MESPEVTVIIPTYNRINILSKTLNAYDQQLEHTPSYELIVINDGSTDDTEVFLNSYLPNNYKIHIYHQINSGPASARNKGISIAKGKYLIFTGDDIIPSNDFIYSHFFAHQNYSCLAVLGKTSWHSDLSINSVMNHIDGRGAQQFSYYYLKSHQYLDFRHFYTSNVSIQRQKILDINEKFDEGFSKAAFEDAELAYRLMGTEKRILYIENIHAYHHHHYDIYNFSERQLGVGRMAVYFANKHPQAAKYIGITEFKKKLNQRFLSSVCHSIYEIEDIESSLLDIFSGFRDEKNPIQYFIYLGIFKYYYFKGIASEYFISDSNLQYTYSKLYFLSSFIAYPLCKFVNEVKRNETIKDGSLKKLTEISQDLLRIKNSLLLLNLDRYIFEKNSLVFSKFNNALFN